MPVTINGTGTISGLSVGGLPDGTVNTAELADSAVTPVKMSGNAPAITVYTSGSGTYTTPANAKAIYVRMIGGGAGGQGISNGVGYPWGGNGGTTSFGSINANGATQQSGGSGGSGTATLRISGATGQTGGGVTSYNVPGGIGAASPFGGGGCGGAVASAGGAASAYGAGGGGAGGNTNWGSVPCGAGGAGEYVELLITSPAATYSYAVGAGGAGGAGASAAGGAGAAGVIFVTAYF